MVTCGPAAFAQGDRSLTVGSMPYNRVSVSVTPADLVHDGDGFTGFSRRYADNTIVNLKAPPINGAHAFVKWQRDGADFPGNASATVTVTMNSDHTMRALYFANNPQLLVNGSFESYYDGWTETGNQYVEDEVPDQATDGINLVTFNGGDLAANGVLSQTFPTVIGGIYTLAFDVGTKSTVVSSQKLDVKVRGSGNNTNLVSDTVTLTGSTTDKAQWISKAYTFTANRSTTTLTFTDTSTTSASIDLLLDNVRVVRSISSPYAVPVVVNDTATLQPGQKVLIPVLGNDSGMIDQSTLQIVSPPATGTAVVDAAGEILYTHSGTGASPVSFTYRVSGAGGVSPTATVNITVSSALRISNDRLNVPDAPPVNAVRVVAAFPGLTFEDPVCLVSPLGDTARLFVCEQGGKIKVIPNVTASIPTSSQVLDLVQVITNPPRVPAESWTMGDAGLAGLLGMAFHPQFATNGYLYVSYMLVKASDPTVLYQRVSRFTVPPAQIGLPAPVATPGSELILIEQRDRYDGHNGSDLHFGPDGYLYWVIGDEANTDEDLGNIQRIDHNFFSAMLRIDVDKKPGNLEPNAHPNPSYTGSTTNSIPRDEIPKGSGQYFARYSIPIDNPSVHTSLGGSWDGKFNGSSISTANRPYVRSEFWAVGLRSPWRFSIDKVTGEIWLADVGHDFYEEIDLITRGGNYGWRYREGLHAGPSSNPPSGFNPINPIYEYPHVWLAGDYDFKGDSIIGGLVYRGTRFSSLTGAYIFADYVSGNIWALTRTNGVNTVKRIAGREFVSSFGTDPSNGDVLLAEISGGSIMRIITGNPDATYPTTLGATRLFADLTDLSPAPGILPYEPNLTFWSDYAVKRRWFSIPDGVGKMAWSRDASWTFPAGQIWVKHFDLETERGNPASPKKRIETRLLVKNAGGVYGLSYRWNEAGTDASLVADGGESFPVNITVGGAPYTQQWEIPSRTQCVTCHSPQAGYALSFNTRQLNRENTINGFAGNQLDLFQGAGYLTSSPGLHNLLPRHVRPDETTYSVEARVRSYIAVNCAYCHAGAAGTAPTAWDGRPELILDQTGLINGSITSGNTSFKLVVPGDTAHSVVLQRMGATGGFTRMPPLGSRETDPVSIALVTQWINQSLPNRRTYAQWRQQTFSSLSSLEGEPGADPDRDGASNWQEFLAGTLATSGASLPTPGVKVIGPSVFLKLNVPENRSVQVESSANLTNWSLWDIPANHGIALPAGEATFSGPAGGANKFYRFLIQER